MMRYYKLTDGERLTAIGTGAGGTEISAEEYAALADEITQKAALVKALADGSVSPNDIREDWREELVLRAQEAASCSGVYTQEALESMTNAELETILSAMGVSVTMTKANMVTLILALQEGVAP